VAPLYDDGAGGLVLGESAMRSQTGLWLLLSLGLSGCGACGEDARERESKRVWGRDKVSSEVAEKAKEPIDARALDERPDLKARVLSMSFDEAVARLGFVEYAGVARFELTRNQHRILVVEDTLLEHGLHGSFRLLQKDEDGAVSRENVYNNGVMYVRSGPGKLHVQGMADGRHYELREEAWQPLRVFTSYFGPRVGLFELEATSVGGRSAVKYELRLLDGSPLIAVPGMSGEKKPISLKGHVLVDEATGVPVGAQLDGVLEIPSKKGGEPGRLTLSLRSTLKAVEGKELQPGAFEPAIAHRPVDLDPLSFLDGGTRTSTVIGGKKKSLRSAADSAEADEESEGEAP
jgi:hypothetical protein